MIFTKDNSQSRITSLQSQLEAALSQCDVLDAKVNTAVEERGKLTADIKRLEGQILEANYILNELEK